MGPISYIGPKTSRAARDRPEQNLEAKISRRNNLPEIVAGRRPLATHRTAASSRAMPRIVLPLTAHGRAPITRPPSSMVRNQRRNNCAGRWLATASHVHNNLRTVVDLHACSGAKLPATMRNGLHITVARWPCNAGHQITQRVCETSDAGRPLCAYRSDQIVDRSYDEVTLILMNRMFIHWTGPAPGPMGRFKSITPILSLEPRVAYNNSTPTNPRPKLAAAPSSKATRHRRLVPPPLAVIGLVPISLTRSFHLC
ncbi:lysine-specific histone demethylase 13 [Dorcoceras hygrometricum]|uniref:Lysine-specific histone demethylase 13 n=1 Tax=Dorcoceras hygrometricum TaxID=472368 RepID=A0A2Z7A8A6_9LAMI|nr:lysine-specific histone demethylase 13 [Dorcoceras hygrometricum]